MIFTLLKQTRSNNCGQTAVAMLTGKTIKEVEKIYGHHRTTYSWEHVFVLKKLLFDLPDMCFKDYQADTLLPELCLVRMAFLKRAPKTGKFSTNGKTKRAGHLVLYYKGDFFDPSGVVYSAAGIPSGMVINRYLEIKSGAVDT